MLNRTNSLRSLGILLLILGLASCAESTRLSPTPLPSPAATRTPLTPATPQVTVNMGIVTPVPRQTPFSAQDINACSAAADCLLVKAGYCGGAEAINRQNSDRWNQYLDEQRQYFEKNPVMCAPSLPLDQYEARCLNRRCQAVYRQQYGLLDFAANPLVGQSVPLRFSLLYAADTPGLRVSILLPEGIEKVSGELDWQGDLPKAQERKLEALVRVTQAGCYIIRGRAVPQNPGISQVFDPVIYLKSGTGQVSFRRQPEAYWDMRFGIPSPENNTAIRSSLIFQPVPGAAGHYTLTYRASSEIDLAWAERRELTLLLPRDAFLVEKIHTPAGGEVFDSGTQVTWQGQIKAGQPVELTLDLKSIQPGAGRVIGFLMVNPSAPGQTRIIDTLQSELYVCE